MNHPTNRISKRWVRGLAGGILATLVGCAGTSRYRTFDHVTVSGESSSSTNREVVERLFASAAPLRVEFLDYELAELPTATGIGGLFLPLVMTVQGLEIAATEAIENGYAFDARVDATVNKIAPACGSFDGEILIGDDGTTTLEMSLFYCNWIVIGNVLTTFKLSVETIDVDAKTITGAYSLRFHGTGNATGSGRFLATLGSLVDESDRP